MLLKKILKTWHWKKLHHEDTDEPSSESGAVSSNSDSEPTKRRRRARQPSEKAAQFDEGHQMENMGTMYEVYVDGKTVKDGENFKQLKI